MMNRSRNGNETSSMSGVERGAGNYTIGASPRVAFADAPSRMSSSSPAGINISGGLNNSSSQQGMNAVGVPKSSGSGGTAGYPASPAAAASPSSQQQQQYHDPRGEMNSNEQIQENNRVKWAFSMDPNAPALGPDGKALLSPGGPVSNQIEDSQVKGDLLDVVRLISTSTVQTQTMEPSYTMTLGNVKVEGDGQGRSIAIQAGTQLERTTSGMQVVEADLAADTQTKRDAFGDPENGEPLLTVGPVSSMHSAYLPTCNVPSTMYPVFMNDARALGISNRYGYIALPKPPVELPPRRRVKAVNPSEYPHLYGSHQPELDDHTGRQLHRAHGLWTSQCGFAPKY